jgi:hypothetical protein
MTLSSLPPDSVELFLARLVQELEGTADREAVVRRFCEERPDLADRVRGLVDLDRVLDDAVGADEPRPPGRLGEFRILRRIGRGGMGEIYEAE